MSHANGFSAAPLCISYTVFSTYINGLTESCHSQMFSKDVQTKLLDDADKYEYKVDKSVCMLHYKQLLVDKYRTKTRRRDMLAVLVKKAKEAHEAELADEGPGEETVNEAPAAR